MPFRTDLEANLCIVVLNITPDIDLLRRNIQANILVLKLYSKVLKTYRYVFTIYLI